MRKVRLGSVAVAMTWAGLAVLTAASGAGQSTHVTTRDLLAQYAAGDRGISRADSLPLDPRLILRDLPDAGSALLKGAPANLEHSRRLIATFVIDVARVAVNTGQARAGFDLLDWARTRLIGQHPEPGHDLPRAADSSPRHFSPPDDFDRHWYHAAMALVENEYSPNALDTDSTQALAQCPGDPRLLLAAAVAEEQTVDGYVEVGRTPPAAVIDRAVTRFQAAAVPPDTFAEAQLRAGHVQLEAHHPDLALPDLDAAIARLDEPGLLYDANLFRGRALESLSRADEAEHAYDTALAVVPGAQSATLALASLAFLRGDRDRADTLSRGLLAAPPVNPDPWSTYGSGDARMFRQLTAILQKDLQ